MKRANGLVEKFGALELDLNGVAGAAGGRQLHAQDIVHEQRCQIRVAVRVAEPGTQLALGQAHVALASRQRYRRHVRLPVHVAHVHLVVQVGVPVQPARPFQAARTLQHYFSLLIW